MRCVVYMTMKTYSLFIQPLAVQTKVDAHVFSKVVVHCTWVAKFAAEQCGHPVSPYACSSHRSHSKRWHTFIDFICRRRTSYIY